MKFPHIMFVSIAILQDLSHNVIGNPRFTAISDSPFLQDLYNRISNEDPPSEQDPATANPFARLRICQDITESGFFGWIGMIPVKTRRTYKRPWCSEIFHQIYQPTKNRFKKLLSAYEYDNPYMLRDVKMTFVFPRHEIEAREYVFMCPLRHTSSGLIVVYYVSKEYNVNIVEPYKPGRFVFGEKRPGLYERPIIAEESARVREEPNFNVELYYLRIRNNRQPAIRTEEDPVCKLATRVLRENQYYRLCAIVLSSKHMRSEFLYPPRMHIYACSWKQISFKTPAAQEESAGTAYSERIIKCMTSSVASHEARVVYISRAYKSNEVFVYTHDHADGGIYLRNLTVDVGIVREPLSFDDVE